ncbi:MAG: iron-sulfur cluster carrier protein ApbC [Chloroflexi bacterium AL-W]|nr:iron-sulfur cluster carrier protein ApbC [Chloroflexi bacterium AL-N1]NOK65423.1 iron-sulfur cluster carrier protein ApbC [Chloroflexi bacterium AL-N10]NOK72311.1 iron-sulfur cluster carrier protein ApbC [Chloroflexi bacterium AL-N5]NOK79602.1 iron-sulfur cluster carrier protein ApbC [Chloroflexi bacterium AL-W]NOK87518.1 iron-sulfur cluster carrier protein ApbC [Chloroflexi bacterium AL-N15]
MSFFSRKNNGISEEDVLRALSTVQEPELGGDLVSRKMIKDVKVHGHNISFTVELTTPACPLKDQIQQECEDAIINHIGVPREHIQIEWSANVRPRGGVLDKAAIPGVSHVIAVSAGKGGVGKSTVAVNTAVALAQEGARVGLVDADVYGPSIPLMMGVQGAQPSAVTDDQGEPSMIPIEAYGIKMMSIGFMIDDSQPVIWRGPMVSQLLRQFLYQVQWAPLDYLIIDMPPGTGDIALTLAQSLQNVGLTGAITVTTPQSVATIDVHKSMSMFRKVNVPLLGIVENMAYFVAPDTGHRYDIFGSGGAERLAEQLEIPLLGQIPLGMSIREGGDDGRPAVLSDMPDAYADAFRSMARQLAARISVVEMEAVAAPTH